MTSSVSSYWINQTPKQTSWLSEEKWQALFNWNHKMTIRIVHVADSFNKTFGTYFQSLIKVSEITKPILNSVAQSFTGAVLLTFTYQCEVMVQNAFITSFVDPSWGQIVGGTICTGSSLYCFYLKYKNFRNSKIKIQKKLKDLEHEIKLNLKNFSVTRLTEEQIQAKRDLIDQEIYQEQLHSFNFFHLIILTYCTWLGLNLMCSGVSEFVTEKGIFRRIYREIDLCPAARDFWITVKKDGPIYDKLLYQNQKPNYDLSERNVQIGAKLPHYEQVRKALLNLSMIKNYAIRESINRKAYSGLLDESAFAKKLFQTQYFEESITHNIVESCIKTNNWNPHIRLYQLSSDRFVIERQHIEIEQRKLNLTKPYEEILQLACDLVIERQWGQIQHNKAIQHFRQFYRENFL